MAQALVVVGGQWCEIICRFNELVVGIVVQK